jgi:hypothetical protein
MDNTPVKPANRCRVPPAGCPRRDLRTRQRQERRGRVCALRGSDLQRRRTSGGHHLRALRQRRDCQHDEDGMRVRPGLRQLARWSRLHR